MASKSKKALEFTFEIFRFPKPKLDREMASEWLDDHHRYLAAALRLGYYSDDADLRGDFAYLAMDLSSVLNACIHVLRTGKPVRVRTVGADIDFSEHMGMLARVMEQRDLMCDRAAHPEEYGFDELVRMFVERIEPTLSDVQDGGAA